MVPGEQSSRLYLHQELITKLIYHGLSCLKLMDIQVSYELYTQTLCLKQPSAGPTFQHAQGREQNLWIPITPFTAWWERGDKVLT